MKMIKWDEIWVEDEAGQTSSCFRGLREWEPKHKALEQEGELRQDRGWCGERKEWVPNAEKWACCFDRHLSPPHHPRLPGDQCKKHTGLDCVSRWETRQDPGSWRQNLHELEEEGPLGADLLCVWVFRTLTIRYRCRHTNFLFLFGYWWRRGWVVTRSDRPVGAVSPERKVCVWGEYRRGLEQGLWCWGGGLPYWDSLQVWSARGSPRPLTPLNRPQGCPPWVVGFTKCWSWLKNCLGFLCCPMCKLTSEESGRNWKREGHPESLQCGYGEWGVKYRNVGPWHSSQRGIWSTWSN